MPIRWDELGKEKYEDMVSVLLSRLCSDAQRIDGKGGDGGRDVQIVNKQTGQIIIAFELKSFTGRMADSQRQQVVRSLNRVSALEPPRWILVVPIDPTPGELSWFRRLGEGYPFPIEWRGKTWLDEKMAAFPDIQRYFMEGANDEVVRLLRELREEQAKVTNVNEAVERLRMLHTRLNEIDPYYRYELSTGSAAAECRPDDVVLSVSYSDMRIDVYPKYLGAGKDRPVTINVKVLFGPGNELVQEALNYGLGATIPSHMISSIIIDAPSGLGGIFAKGEVDLLPTIKRFEKPIAVALNLMDGNRLVAGLPVSLTEQSRGLRGSVLTGADSTGWLQCRLKVDVLDKKIEAKFWLDPNPAMPAALVPLFKWLAACQPPNHLALSWPRGLEMRKEIQTANMKDDDLVKVVEALAYLQDFSRNYWVMEPSVIESEGQEVVTAVSLLKGEKLDLKWSSFKLSLNQSGPGLEGLLSGHSQQIICDQDMWLELDGVTMPIGRIRTYIESARLVDPVAVQLALKSGLLPKLHLVPGDSNKAERVLVSSKIEASPNSSLQEDSTQQQSP